MDEGLKDELRRREIRAPTRQYSYRYSPSRSGLEIHLSGERWVVPKTRVELALHASVCVANLNNQGQGAGMEPMVNRLAVSFVSIASATPPRIMVS